MTSPGPQGCHCGLPIERTLDPPGTERPCKVSRSPCCPLPPASVPLHKGHYSFRSKAGDTQSHPVPQNHQVISLILPLLRFVLPGPMWGHPTSGHPCAHLCPMGRRAEKDPWPWDHPAGPRLAEWLPLPLLSPLKPHQATLPTPTRSCPWTAGATAGLDAQGTKLPSPGLLAAEGLAARASTARCLPGTASPGT